MNAEAKQEPLVPQPHAGLMLGVVQQQRDAAQNECAALVSQLQQMEALRRADKEHIEKLVEQLQELEEQLKEALGKGLHECAEGG